MISGSSIVISQSFTYSHFSYAQKLGTVENLGPCALQARTYGWELQWEANLWCGKSGI